VGADLQHGAATSVELNPAAVPAAGFISEKGMKSVTNLLNVTFTPTTSDSVVGAISVTAIVPLSEDSNINPNSSLSVPLSGTGLKSA